MAGPLSPPCSTWDRAVSFSPPRVLVSPWHVWHFSIRSGRTSFSKNSTSLAVGSAAASHAGQLACKRSNATATPCECRDFNPVPLPNRCVTAPVTGPCSFPALLGNKQEPFYPTDE